MYPRIFLLLLQKPRICSPTTSRWCPFEPIRWNIELIPEKNHRLYLFVKKCLIIGSLRSFSYGVHTQTVKATKWEAKVYTDDPAVFEAHLQYKFRIAREIIEGKFTFFSVQDRIMTPFDRRVRGGTSNIAAERGQFLNDETMKVYERPFIRYHFRTANKWKLFVCIFVICGH